MGEHVDGIRETFYRRLVDDYKEKKEEESFLYRAFWRENVAGVLKMLDEVRLHGEKIFPGLLEELDGNFPQLPKNKSLSTEDKPKIKGRLDFHNFAHQLDPKDAPRLKKQLAGLMREHKKQLEELIREHGQQPDQLTGEQKQQAKCLPLKKRERWDFWTELWLNDAYCEAGLIAETDYYLWLVECLTAHGIYYTDKNLWVWDGHTWLYVLLLAGLEDTALDPCKMWGKELQGNNFEGDYENNLDKAWVEKDLAELAGLIKSVRDSDGIARNKKGAGDARVLLDNLERVSIHYTKLVPKNKSDTGKKASENEKNTMKSDPENASDDGKKPPKNETDYVQKDINVRTKVQVGRDLAALAKMMQDEKDKGGREIACRLQGLKYPEKFENSFGWVEYLPWLTGQLERMALHSNIKTWLQDSGYTIGKKEKDKDKDKAGDEDKDEDEYELKKSPKGPRKQDFTMRLFEEYFVSTKGRDFNLMGQETEAASRQVSMGFCVLEPDQHEKLRKAMEKSGRKDFYLPLAVDLYSGCVFFLAGKGNYEHLYKNPKTRKEIRDKENYDKAKANCCFDYLRLDEEALEYPENIGKGKAFRLEPVFHLNAEKDAQTVLREFKTYCMIGAKSPRRLVREFNMQAPDGIPEEFCRIFEPSDRPKKAK